MTVLVFVLFFHFEHTQVSMFVYLWSPFLSESHCLFYATRRHFSVSLTLIICQVQRFYSHYSAHLVFLYHSFLFPSHI